MATSGVILGAAYMLWMVQKVFFGQLTHEQNHHLKDLGLRELAAVLPFVGLIAVMGLRPQPILDVINHSTERFVNRVQYANGSKDIDERKVKVRVYDLPKKTVAVSVNQPTIAARNDLSAE